jgi:hypothetical protein
MVVAPGKSRGLPRAHRSRAVLALLTVIVLAALSTLLAVTLRAGGAYAESDSPQVDPPAPSSSTEGPAPSKPAPSNPVESAPASSTAPAVKPPVPARGISVHADNFVIDGSYWAGGGGAGAIAITVTSSAATSQVAKITYILPAGVEAIGCACVNPDLKPRGRWRTELRLTVDPDAWRHAPLVSTVTVTVPGSSATDEFLTVLPPGPPTPGVRLAVADLSLIAADPTTAVGGYLMVRFGNTGTSPANGAIEVVTPAGVEITAVGPECRSQRLLAPDRARCELGMIDPGADHTLTFALSIKPSAQAASPLDGSVFGYFTPVGQNTATVQAAYRISVSPAGQAAPLAAADDPVVAGGDDGGGIAIDLSSRRLEALPVILIVVGLVLASIFVALVSLRRRLRDDITPAPPTAPTDDPVTAGKQPVTRG